MKRASKRACDSAEYSPFFAAPRLAQPGSFAEARDECACIPPPRETHCAALTMAKKKKKKASPVGELLVCSYPRVERDYEIEERIECGMVLTGSEVKSLRAKRADLEGAYASIERMELFLHGMHIAPYEQAGRFGHEPKRKRKLLAHRREIERLLGRTAQRGYALVPTRVYFRNGRAKVELALGKGRKAGDNREAIRRKIDLREARNAMGRAGKG